MTIDTEAHAYHEVSHAVIWLLYWYEVLSVELLPGEAIQEGDKTKTNWGKATHGNYIGPHPCPSRGPSYTYVIGILAAGSGEKKQTGKVSEGLHADFDLVRKHLKNVASDKAQKFIDDVYSQLDVLLSQPDA